jgi:hypothetical protein
MYNYKTLRAMEYSWIINNRNKITKINCLHYDGQFMWETK